VSPGLEGVSEAEMEKELRRRELVKRALYRYGAYNNDDIDIDENAQVSEAEGGAWVQGWLWIPEGE